MRPEDSFGLVLFNSTATVLQPLAAWKDIDSVALEKQIMKLRAEGGTNISKAVTAATDMYTTEQTERYVSSVSWML